MQKMVIYFTGTGNSLWTAKSLSKSFHEPLVSIAAALLEENHELTYTLRDDEHVMIVFPVHSWGPAAPVMQFINRLTLCNYAGQRIDMVCTCGDECGYTSDIIRKALKKRGLDLFGSYSIQMPNNYIMLPGFDVDSNVVESSKLEGAQAQMDKVIHAIRQESSDNLYTVGGAPGLKSYVIYPMFASWFINKNSFFATDACTSCGLCERICPTRTISMVDMKPQWSKGCVQCLGCIHRCPVRAIESGKSTQHKGRYKHPELTAADKY